MGKRRPAVPLRARQFEGYGRVGKAGKVDGEAEAVPVEMDSAQIAKPIEQEIEHKRPSGSRFDSG